MVAATTTDSTSPTLQQRLSTFAAVNDVAHASKLSSTVLRTSVDLCEIFASVGAFELDNWLSGRALL